MEPTTKFIILKSHPNGIYPGLHPMLRAWRSVVMDPANKGCAIVVEISTTPALVADQCEIGNFLRNNYTRLHHLKISGERAFHLNLAVTGNTTVNLKAVHEEDDDDTTWKSNLDAISSWTESDNDGDDDDDDDDDDDESDDECDSMAHSQPLLAPHFCVGEGDTNDSGYEDVEFTDAY